MNLCPVNPSSEATVVSETFASYAMMPLRELAQRVAALGDPMALAELHQRTPFHLNGNGQVGLVGLLDHLRRHALHQAQDLEDRAYDLTLDKFSRLEPAGALGRNGTTSAHRRPRTDCRRYFEAYVRHLAEQQALDRRTELEREMYEARALQSLVRHHFSLALRECQRTSFMTRFVWHLPTGDLSLLMPRSISGRGRRQWLETNIPDADPSKASEQMRVQAIIDASIGQPRHLTLADDAALNIASPFLAAPTIPGEELFNISVEGLAECVAREKAANIIEQRPAIQALGPAKLQEMILSIFDSLAEDGYSLAEVAQQYGLSKPTLSRFAGLRWNTAKTGDSIVPDLWRNTAKVIGSDPEFVQAAKTAGVWRRIEEAAALTTQ